MSQSPFDALPEEVVLCIATYLGSWQPTHAAFLCTTRTARFTIGWRGHGARSVFLRYFSAYISALTRYEECNLHLILHDMARYAIPLPGQRLPTCHYAAGHFEIQCTDWTTVFTTLRALYRAHCQRIIGLFAIPHITPGISFDCVKTVRLFRHMHENQAITMFQLCFGLQKIFTICNDDAQDKLDENGHGWGIRNLCAGDAALTSWINASPRLKQGILAFSGCRMLSCETAIPFPQTRIALGLRFFENTSHDKYASKIFALQGRRPGCNTCHETGRPCIV